MLLHTRMPGLILVPASRPPTCSWTRLNTVLLLLLLPQCPASRSATPSHTSLLSLFGARFPCSNQGLDVETTVHVRDILEGLSVCARYPKASACANGGSAGSPQELAAAREEQVRAWAWAHAQALCDATWCCARSVLAVRQMLLCVQRGGGTPSRL